MGGDVMQIGVEAPMRPPTIFVETAAAESYWNLYPDIKTHPYYGASPKGAWEHYDTFGRAEGRTWPGAEAVRDIRILDYCGAAVGSNCIEFTNGAWISAIAWESTVKTPNSEVLAILRMDGTDGSSKALMNAHHLGPGNKIKTITLHDPIHIAPGSTVWIWAEGWGDPHPYGFETQTMLYFTGTAEGHIRR